MSFAMRQSCDRDDHESIRRQPIGLADHLARPSRAEPEIRYAETHRADALRIDGKPFAEQVLGIAAVGDDLGPRSENAGAADRQPLQRRLGLVDLGAVHGHHHAGRRPPARKRQRNEERPVGGVNHVVAAIANLAARQQDLCRQIPHRVQAAGKADHFKRPANIVGGGGLAIVGSHHRHPRAEARGGGCDFPDIGADAPGRRGKLAGQHQDVHVSVLNTRARPSPSSRAHPGFPDDSGTRAPAASSA